MNRIDAAIEIPIEPSLRLERVVNAPRDLVFRVWTTPEHMRHWWGPRDEEGRDFTTPHLEMDFRPQGAYRIGIRSQDGRELWQRGVYLEIVEPERIVFTFAWEEPAVETATTLIEVTFAEHGGGQTLLTLTQTGFSSEASRDNHRPGWQGFLDRCEQYLQDEKTNLDKGKRV